MKKIISVIAIIAISAAMLAVSSCNKLPEGTGVLIVNISNLQYDTDVEVYPYVLDDLPAPIASQPVKKGTTRTVTFTLNVGNYIVDCGAAAPLGGGTATVQIQEGQESNLYFYGK